MSNETNSAFAIENNQLYMELKDAGPSALLISSALLLNFVSIPGIFMNFAVIFVTIKHRSLRSSSSSCLLALTAFYEMVHAFGHLLFLFLALFGINFIPYSLCFKFLLIPFMANMASICTISLTGLDRLLQLAFAKSKRNLNHPAYLLPFLFASLAAGAINGLRYYQYSLEIPHWPQTGHIGDVLPGTYGQWHLVYMLALNAAAILLYVAIWAMLRMKTASQSIHSHLLKSMVIIVCINIGGYLANAAIRMFLIPLFGLDQCQTWIAFTYLGILLNLCVTLNAAVLYICSSEYRSCFRHEFNWIFRKNAIQTIPSNIHVSASFNRQMRRSTVENTFGPKATSKVGIVSTKTNLGGKEIPTNKLAK